jgi:hypothetical protein
VSDSWRILCPPSSISCSSRNTNQSRGAKGRSWSLKNVRTPCSCSSICKRIDVASTEIYYPCLVDLVSDSWTILSARCSISCSRRNTNHSRGARGRSWCLKNVRTPCSCFSICIRIGMASTEIYYLSLFGGSSEQ